MTAVPSRLDPRWRDVVTGKRTTNFSMLASKMLMLRIVMSAKNDPSTTNISKCCSEVYEFFEKNKTLAASDIAALFR